MRTGTAPLDSVEDGASSCAFHCIPDMRVPHHTTSFSDELPMGTKCFAGPASAQNLVLFSLCATVRVACLAGAAALGKRCTKQCLFKR